MDSCTEHQPACVHQQLAFATGWTVGPIVVPAFSEPPTPLPLRAWLSITVPLGWRLRLSELRTALLAAARGLGATVRRGAICEKVVVGGLPRWILSLGSIR
jgi:hypothetical protein